MEITERQALYMFKKSKDVDESFSFSPTINLAACSPAVLPAVI